MQYVTCPNCGLTILPNADWLTVEHCPRCIARRRMRVTMLAAAAPVAERRLAGALLDDAAAPTLLDGEV
jgi:hypothetical protein